MIRQHVERELERRAYRQGEKLTREVLADKPLFALSADEVAQMKAVVARLARKIKDALALRQRQEQRGRSTRGGPSARACSTAACRWSLPLAPPAPREAEAGHALRRLRLRAQRLALHAPARLEPPGVLQPSAPTCSSRRSPRSPRRSGPAGGAGHRVGAQGRAGRLPLPVGLRLRVQPLRQDRARAARPEDDDPHPGRRRNNYNDPQAWALRLIRERVKGIIWLNPEGQWGWGIGDSVMPLYAPSCDLVRECRTRTG